MLAPGVKCEVQICSIRIEFLRILGCAVYIYVTSLTGLTKTAILYHPVFPISQLKWKKQK